jgi:hypothetical protein
VGLLELLFILDIGLFIKKAELKEITDLFFDFIMLVLT